MRVVHFFAQAILLQKNFGFRSGSDRYMHEGTHVNGTQGANADGYAATMQEEPGEPGGVEHEDIEHDSARRARRPKILRKESDDQYSRRHVEKRQSFVVGLTPAQERVSITWGKTKLNISRNIRKTTDGCNVQWQRSEYIMLEKRSSSHMPRRHHR